MDKVEIAVNGFVSGDPDDPNQGPALDTVCQECHKDRTSKLSCSSTKWKNHLLEGRVAEKVWLHVTETVTGVPGESCGW